MDLQVCCAEVSPIPITWRVSDTYNTVSVQTFIMLGEGPDTAHLVSAVIGNWNRVDDLKVAVQSVRNQDWPNKEIIVVDNQSSDGSIEWCRQQPDVRLIIMRCDLGASVMLDTGFLSAAGKYVICMDNDGELLEGAIRDAVYTFEHLTADVDWSACLVQPEVREYLRKGFRIGCITPKMYKGDDGKLKGKLDIKEGLFRLDTIDTNIQFHGACCFFLKEAGDSVGWYNPEYYLYDNEVDLGARLYKNNYLTIYVPYIETVHHVSETTRVRPRLLYYAIRHYYWMIWEHLPLGLALYHTLMWFGWAVFSAWRYPKTFFMAHLSAFCRMPWVLMRRDPITDKRMTQPWDPNMKKEFNIKRWLELIIGEEAFGTKVK